MYPNQNGQQCENENRDQECQDSKAANKKIFKCCLLSPSNNKLNKVISVFLGTPIAARP